MSPASRAGARCFPATVTCCCGWLTNARDGSLTLSDVRGPTLAIVCEPCDRRGRYSVDRLMAQHGDAKLTDLLHTLADCPKARSVSVHDRCKALYKDSASVRGFGLRSLTRPFSSAR